MSARPFEALLWLALFFVALLWVTALAAATAVMGAVLVETFGLAQMVDL